MKARIKHNNKIIEGEFKTSSGKTGVPPGRYVFTTTDNKEYYPEHIKVF